MTYPTMRRRAAISRPNSPPSQESGPSRLEEERRLLIEALTGAFGAYVPTAKTGGDQAAEGQSEAHGTAGSTRAGADFDGPDAARTAGAQAQVGCGQCGCKAPRACTVCPICRTAAGALDPALLERVADAAQLVAEGLRAAARKVAAMDERDRS